MEPRFRITYFDPYDPKVLHVHEHRSPGGRLGWNTRAEAQSWVNYMKMGDPWKHMPALADTLRVEEIEN